MLGTANVQTKPPAGVVVIVVVTNVPELHAVGVWATALKERVTLFETLKPVPVTV
jgi:hypothetical protein